MIPEIEAIRERSCNGWSKQDYKQGFDNAYAATLKHLAGSEADARKVLGEMHPGLVTPMIKGQTSAMLPNTDEVISLMKQHTAIHTAQLLLKVQELEAEVKRLSAENAGLNEAINDF